MMASLYGKVWVFRIAIDGFWQVRSLMKIELWFVSWLEMR